MLSLQNQEMARSVLDPFPFLWVESGNETTSVTLCWISISTSVKTVGIPLAIATTGNQDKTGELADTCTWVRFCETMVRVG